MSNLDGDIDWAEIVDILAREYGWTIDYIKSLDLGQITKLLTVIRSRYNKQTDSDDGSTNTSKDKELSIADFKAMGGKEVTREDGRKEIII